MFSAKTGFDLRFSSQSLVFLRKHRSRVDWLDAKFHLQQCGKRLLYFGERLLYFGERRLFSEKGVYIFEIPTVEIWWAR